MNMKTMITAVFLFAGIGLVSAQHTRTSTYVVQDDVSKQAYYQTLQDNKTLTSEQSALKMQNAQENSSTWAATGFTFTGDPVLDMAAYTSAKQGWLQRNENFVPSVGTRTLGNAQLIMVQPSVMLNVDR